MVAHPAPKEAMTKLARAALRSFLDSGCVLDCRPAAEPRVSILMLVCNRAELTLACLQTLALRLNQVPFETVIVDNGSTDETARLLERVQGLKVHRNGENVGFPAGVNQAARLATGEFLLLLNNDTQVLGRSIDVAADFLAAHPDVGAAGGKVVLLDGTLQEGGCLIVQDGYSQQQGRGEDVDHPAFAFQREVDYCSGVFLMTRRELFEQLGGLDETFGPGYFEDADYCVRLRKAGYRIVYLPEAITLHYENATSSGLFDVPASFHRNRARFAARHADWLRTQPSNRWPPWVRRFANRDAFRVLLLGDGFAVQLPPEPACRELSALLSRIESLDGIVTLCLTGAAAEAMQPMLERLPKTTELLCRNEVEQVRQLLEDRVLCYDLVLLSDAGERDRLGLPWLASVPCALWRNGKFALLGDDTDEDVAADRRAA
jgi:GT2 family glycosyltransferase